MRNLSKVEQDKLRNFMKTYGFHSYDQLETILMRRIANDVDLQMDAVEYLLKKSDEEPDDMHLAEYGKNLKSILDNFKSDENKPVVEPTEKPDKRQSKEPAKKSKQELLEEYGVEDFEDDFDGETEVKPKQAVWADEEWGDDDEMIAAAAAKVQALEQRLKA